MRIAVCLTYYAPHWTGLTVVARQLAEGMAARGHQVTIVTAQHERALPRVEEVNGLHVVRVPTRARVSRAVVMPGYPAALAKAVAESDVVHLHSPMPEAALVAGVAAARGRPLVITHHGDVVMPAGLIGHGIRRSMELSNGVAMRAADMVVVHTADYAACSPFLRRAAPRLCAVYPPVSVPAPRPDAVRTWRRELGLTGRPVVGFAGRFVEEKGFDYLLKAVPAVQQVIPDAGFVFAGDTDIAYERFYEKCRDLIEENRASVMTLGLIRDQQRMADFYAMCDLFVLPSRSDCFAIVQVEAMLCGTPVVATDIPGAREVVRRTGSGQLARPCDPVDLAAAIVRVLQDPARYRPDPTDVRRLFDPEASLDHYEEIFKRAVERRSAGSRGRWSRYSRL